MDILVASFNTHKIDELKPLFASHRLLSPTDLGYREMEIEEDGSSYFENALIKAKALYSLAGMPTLADDSGLSVATLGGAPGIHSSRYGSKDGRSKLSTAERNALLLAEMEGVEDRACAFYCCLVFMYGHDRFLSVQETCPGILAETPRGAGGFGYDPLVFLPELGKTVAELDPEQKNMVSHRGRASRTM
ncbi:MAG: non-canonical purine NTP pyrophosphatase, partial [Spirochaetales bacterium]